MLKKIMKNEYRQKIDEVIKRLKDDKKALLIIICAVIGMVMILLSGGTGDSKKSAADNKAKSESAVVNEEKLQKLLSEIEGAGKVKVMITYEESEEEVFAFDKDEKLQSGEQNFKSDYIIIKNDEGETGLKLKTVYPEVRGVAVVCSGADNPVTKERIISVVSALFDISTKNISVVCAEK